MPGSGGSPLGGLLSGALAPFSGHGPGLLARIQDEINIAIQAFLAQSPKYGDEACFILPGEVRRILDDHGMTGDVDVCVEQGSGEVSVALKYLRTLHGNIDR